MPRIESEHLNIYRKNGNIPKVPFFLIKNKILGSKYNLNIIFQTADENQQLNIKYRQKEYKPNILSFPIDKDNGEIYISLQIARTQYKDFDMSYNKYIHLLIVHGCLHLKGHIHSRRMDELELKYTDEFYGQKDKRI